MDTPTPPPRCQFSGCKKKLTLTSSICKCKNYYCSSHRHSETHNCTFDYRAEQKSSLNRFMSTAIVAAKVESI